MDPLQRHTSGATTALLIRYVRARGGEQAVKDMLERAGEQRTADQLEDETTWSTYDQKIALFEAAAEVLGDPEVTRRVGEMVIDLRVALPLKLMLRALGSPAAVLRNVAKAAPRFSTVCEMEAVEVRADRAVVTYRLDDGFEPHPLDCAYNQGLLSQVPVLFGLPPAAIHHPACQVTGAERCIYELRWMPRSRLPWRARARRIALLEDQLQTLSERAADLRSTIGDLVSPEDITAVLERIARRAAGAVRAQAALLAVRLPGERGLEVHADGLSGDEARALAQRLLAGEEPEGLSVVTVPVASSHHDYGVLAALYRRAGAFFAEDSEVLADYARHAAVALDSTTTLARAKRREAAAHALLELARALAGASNATEVIERVTSSAPGIVGCERAAFFSWDATAGVLRCEAWSGFAPEHEAMLRELVVTPADTPELATMLAEPTARHYDAATEDDYVRAALRSFGSAELLVVPVTFGGELIGALFGDRRIAGPPLPGGALETLGGLADQAATALAKIRLLERERRTVQRLREADSFKTRFLAMVSHDLRTPIAVILGNVKTLQARADRLGEGERAELLDAIARRSEQLQRLVEDLLQSTRDIELSVGPADLSALLRAALADVLQLHPGADVELSCPVRLPLVADEQRLRQVIDNLVSNALKHAPGAPLELRAGRSGALVWFEVADEGPGMDPALAARATEPYVQGAGAGSGVGLGLYITRRLVDAHGGRLQIASLPGEGTTVRVELPTNPL